MVDIVLGPDGQHWLPCNSPYVFSGTTLDKLPGLTSWPEKDRGAFEAWLCQETQVREIDSVRRRVVPDELPLIAREFDYPSRLYSTLQRRIERLRMRRAAPQQWKQTLLNMRRNGVRDEELEWSGLLSFLSLAQGQGKAFITREELLTRISFSSIRLSLSNELTNDKGCGLEFMEVKQSKSLNRLGMVSQLSGTDAVSVLRYVDTLHYYKVGYLKRRCTGWGGQQQWFALDTIGQLIPAVGKEPYYDSKEAAFHAASEHSLQHVGLPVAYTPCSRYEHKTLCGGEDYREWLLTLPDYPISYFNKHYYERNLLLHFRTKQRRDQQDRRLLFVEEIQSDWHQSGAVKGYQNRWPGQMPPAPFTKEWIGLALKLLLIHAAEKGYDGIGWVRGEIQESHYRQALNPVRRLYDEVIPRTLRRILRGIKGADLVTTTIATKEPRLNIERELDKWLVTDSQGSFLAKPRSSQREAMQLIARHCRQIDLDVPMLTLSDAARGQIIDTGFPLFGETILPDY
jgi:hypothetical protein